MNSYEWMEAVKATLGQNGKRDATPFQHDETSPRREKLTFSLDPILRFINWKRQNDRAFVPLETDKHTASASAFRQDASLTSNRQQETCGMFYRPPPPRMNRKPRQRLPAAARKQHRATCTTRRSTALATMPTILENDEISLESV